MNQKGSNQGGTRGSGSRRVPGAQAITPPSQPRLHERIQSASPSRLDAPQPKPGKTTRSIPRKSATTRVPPAGDGTKRRIVAAKKDNTSPIIAGAVGGLVLIIVVIAAAASGGGPVQRPPVQAPVAAPVVEEELPVDKQDTGPITFACTGSTQHEDEEKMVNRCTACSGRAPFFWDYKEDKFRCYECRALFPIDDFTCPDCGKKPTMKPYIKHRPK